MRTTRILALAVAVLVASTTSALAAARTTRTKVVYQKDGGVVQPNKTDGFTERCPAAAPHAITGYFGSDSPAAVGKLTLSSSFPVGKGDRQWAVTVKNLSDQPQTYFVGVVCVSGRHAFVRVENTGTIDVGGNNGGAVACPSRAPYPVAGYFGAQARAGEGQFILSQSAPGGRSWGTQLSNISALPQAFFVGVVCAPRGQKVSYLSSNQTTLDPAATRVAGGTCGGATPHAVNGFYFIPPSANFGPVTMYASSNSGTPGRDWLVAVTNLSQQPQQFAAGSVCLR